MCDVIHKPPRRSIYDRTDYIVNSDMAIPTALAGTLRTGIATESIARRGLPPVSRAPELSPLVLRQPALPKGK